MMVNIAEDSLALAAGTLAMFFVLRMKRTYFLDSRFFIGVANIAFNLILVQALWSDLAGLLPSPLFFVGMISITAISIGFASYLLESKVPNSGLSELRAFLSDPPRPFLVYLAVVLGWAISGLILQPWSLVPRLGQEGVFYYSYELWYLGLSSVLLATFIYLPVAAVYHLSKGMSDSKASRSLKIISISWSGFGIISLFQVALPTVESAGILLESILFIMTAFALREPTVLSRILSPVSSVQQNPYSPPGRDTIVLYNLGSDRRKLIESFVRNELKARRRAVCFVARGEVPFYSAILRGMGVPLLSFEDRGVSIQPIENMLSDSSSPPNVESELIDLGELGIIQSRRIVEREKALDALDVRPKRNRTWAINTESAHPSLLGIIRDLNPKGRTIDQANYQDSFSNVLGVRHQDILGNGLLLEFDPSSRYEELVQKFVDEFQTNVEPVALFTSLGSPLHRGLRRLQGVRLFSFSTKTSTPSKGLGEEVLLPERDSSLLLDAVDKVLETNQGQNVGIAFDVFTDLVLLQGFDKTYGVLSAVVEMAGSRSATTLVLLNQLAHEEKVLNGVRGLFGSQLACDTAGVRLVRFKDPSTRKPYDLRGSLVEGAVSRGVTGR